MEVENPPQAPLVSEEIFEREKRNKNFISSMEPNCANTTGESNVVFGNTLQTLRQRNEKKCENAQIENNTTSDLGGDHLRTFRYRVSHVYFRLHILFVTLCGLFILI